MPSADFLSATFSLFEDGLVDAVEWSFDTLWDTSEFFWLESLIQHYSDGGRLFGHGVTFSLLSGRWTEGHAEWIEKFKIECARRKYVHVSEHFGFTRAGKFVDNSPLPVPLSKKAVQIGVERLNLMREICAATVGLENLGFAFSLDDVKEQAEFIATLLNDADAFLLLDLHNAYCQMANFGMQGADFLKLYPLDRVREIHLSGGAWSHDSNGLPIRRDTHNDVVPEPVFALFEDALKLCPNIKTVIFERLSNTIKSAEDEIDFRADFLRIKDLTELHTYARG